jgi:dihydroorotate dehydrogenase (fumarate)
MDLTTRYMGLDLKNPLVASASPLTGELGNLRQLEDAGAAAIVLPSLFQEHIEAEARRYEALTEAGADSFPEALSYFPAQSLSHAGPERYLTLVRRAVEAVDLPIIGSLNGTTNEGWIDYAKQVEQAGAAGIELNVYFIPTDLSLTGGAVEQRYLEILAAVRAAITIPVAVKVGPYFSAFGQMAQELDRAGANALVLFNRFYQPDIDLAGPRMVKSLELSRRDEIRLPLLWIGVLSGRIRASLAASTGVESAEEVLKYLLTGADVVMTTSALLRHGVQHVATLLSGVSAWLAARDLQSLDQVRGLLSQQKARTPGGFVRANYIEILQGYDTRHSA